VLRSAFLAGSTFTLHLEIPNWLIASREATPMPELMNATVGLIPVDMHIGRDLSSDQIRMA
jgi:hypothetical protein